MAAAKKVRLVTPVARRGPGERARYSASAKDRFSRSLPVTASIACWRKKAAEPAAALWER
jgi:hypothetical protein